MRIHIAVVLVFVLSCSMSQRVEAQDIVTTTDVLRRLVSERSFVPYSRNVDYLRQEAKGLPLLEGIELRTETDQWDLAQQQLSLRMSFNSRAEQKAVSGMFSSMKDIYLNLQEEYLIDEIATTYQDLVELYFAGSEADVIDKELAVLRDRSQYIRNLMENTQQVKVENWLGIQEDLIEAMNDSIEISQQVDILTTRLRVGSTLSFFDMISIDQIRADAQKSTMVASATLKMRRTAAEEDKARYEFQLEEAESDKWLDFVQVQYQSDDRISFQDEVSFGTSIRLPTSSRNRVKRQEAALELYEKKYDRMIADRDAAQDRANIDAELFRSIAIYDRLKSDLEALRLDQVYETYLQTEGVSPDALLQIRQSMIDFDKKLLDARSDVYREYLRLVEIGIGANPTKRTNLISKEKNKY